MQATNILTPGIRFGRLNKMAEGAVRMALAGKRVRVLTASREAVEVRIRDYLSSLGEPWPDTLEVREVGLGSWEGIRVPAEAFEFDALSGL